MQRNTKSLPKQFKDVDLLRDFYARLPPTTQERIVSAAGYSLHAWLNHIITIRVRNYRIPSEERIHLIYKACRLAGGPGLSKTALRRCFSQRQAQRDAERNDTRRIA